MNVHFESDYQKKVLYVSFVKKTSIQSTADIIELQKKWFSELSSWHSPYKALVDCENLSIEAGNDKQESLEESLDRFFKILKKFFLKKVVGFGFDSSKGHDSFPFQVFGGRQEALKDLGVREQKKDVKVDDFRSLIQFDNHFQQHVVELSFRADAFFDDEQKLRILQSKLTNNLMLWHSSWSLLIDCKNLEFDKNVFSAFSKLEASLKGFFLKKVVGYMPKNRKLEYPFPVFLSRHKAALILKGEIPTVSGNEANCSTRKTPAGESK